MTLTEPLARLRGVLEALLNTTGDRIGAPFLIGALLIACVVWWRRVRPAQSIGAFLFPRSIWWHRSARLDYALLITRLILDALVLSSFAVSSTAVTFAVARGLWRWVGILPPIHMSTWLITASFSIAAFIAEDFTRYWVHRAFHHIPALWELHKLHHSAEVLTPFTIYRVHPIEGLLNAGCVALAVGLVGGIVSWIFPGQLAAWTIAGIYALQYVWNALGTNLRHSHVWLSYGPHLEHWLISPAQHQVHHSTAPEHHDRNFGSALAVWDRLFASLYVTRERQRLTFGVAPSELNHEHHVTSALLDPLRRCVSRLAGRRDSHTLHAQAIPTADRLREHDHA